MYKHCSTEESVRRQRQLEQSLLDLMLTIGYNSITIADICDRVGITRKSFYRYFSSKEGCLHALLDHAVIDGAYVYLSDTGTSPLIYPRFFQYWKEKRNLLEALIRNSMSGLLVEKMLAYTMQEEQEFRIFLHNTADITREQNIFYLGGIINLLLDWHQSGYQRSIAEMADILSRLIG